MPRSPSSPAVLWIVPGVYFVFVGAEFAAMTHLALQATAGGRSAFAVGLLATAMWSGILLASLRAHAAVARHGHARVATGATLLALAAIVSMALHTAYAGWLAAAFALGLGGGLVWVAGESWLAEAAPAGRRGFFVGLFETSVGLGLMAGPALIPLAAALGWAVPVLAALLMALAAALSALLLRLPLPPSHDEPGAAGTPARADWRPVALPLIGIAVASGLMEAGVSALFPSLSMRLGFDVQAAAWLGTVIGAGSALLQPPAGLAADRWGVRRITLGCWAVVLATNAALALLAHEPGRVLWAVGFTLGGVGGAVYTLVIVELGHRLAGAALVKAIGALVTGYSLGTAAGPAIGGAVFDASGLRGLALLLLALAALGMALSWRGLRPPGRMGKSAA